MANLVSEQLIKPNSRCFCVTPPAPMALFGGRPLSPLPPPPPDTPVATEPTTIPLPAELVATKSTTDSAPSANLSGFLRRLGPAPADDKVSIKFSKLSRAGIVIF